MLIIISLYNKQGRSCVIFDIIIFLRSRSSNSVARPASLRQRSKNQSFQPSIATKYYNQFIFTTLETPRVVKPVKSQTSIFAQITLGVAPDIFSLTVSLRGMLPLTGFAPACSCPPLASSPSDSS